jgi:hypothetical protein
MRRRTGGVSIMRWRARKQYVFELKPTGGEKKGVHYTGAYREVKQILLLEDRLHPHYPQTKTEDKK